MSNEGGILKGWMQKNVQTHQGPMGMTEPIVSSGSVVNISPTTTINTTSSTTITPTPKVVSSIDPPGMKIFNPKKKSPISLIAPQQPGPRTDEPPIFRSPVVQESVPIVQESVPVVQESVPVVQESVPIVQESVPVVQESVPDKPVELLAEKVELMIEKMEAKKNELVKGDSNANGIKKKSGIKGIFNPSEIMPKSVPISENNKLNNIKMQESTKSVETPDKSTNDNPVFEYDRYFINWLTDNKVSLLISSYKAQRVISIGSFYDEASKITKLSMWLTYFNRPMGLVANEKTCWVSASGNMWKFENTGEYEDTRESIGKFDANYVIRRGHFSSDIDNHDICMDTAGEVYYCSAAFSCICTTSDDKSFKVFWKPPWITKIVPEDRCHLNGICSRDGVPRYVSSVSQSNVRGGWRENRIGKGIIYDIVENKIVCEGLTMPHSPRWYNGKLYVLDAGTGYFGYVDLEKKSFVEKVWLPGYLRGMSFVSNRYVVVGTSEDRHENVFMGLPLGDALSKNGVTAKCGIHVIDMNDFSVPHNLIFNGGPDNELYDVIAVKGIRRPKLTDITDSTNMTNYNIDYGIYKNL
jgi:uncharacterized protein (TIGR03032 family)